MFNYQTQQSMKLFDTVQLVKSYYNPAYVMDSSEIQQLQQINHKANAQMDNMLAMSRRSSRRKFHAWGCINPPASKYTLQQLYWKSNLPYQHYQLVIEQNTKNGIRPHVHFLALVNNNTRPNKEISRLAKQFDVSENFVEYKISTSEQQLISRGKYLRGEKAHEKMKYVELDKIDRLEDKIPDLISIGDIYGEN